MSETITLARLRELLKDPSDALVAAFEGIGEDRCVELFLQLRSGERAELLQRIPDGAALRVLELADSTTVASSIALVERNRARTLLAALQPDEAADIARRLTPDHRTSLFSGLGNEEEVQRLLMYPEGTAGALMNTRYVSVPEVITVARALDLVRQAGRAESIYYIYVVDSSGRLVGTLSVRNLLVASPRAMVRDIATRRIVNVSLGAASEEIVREFQTHKFLALPVVDERERLVGVVTLDDAMGAIREEEEVLVYSVTGVNPREHLIEGMRAARGRLPWIGVTILGGLLCAGIGALFRGTLESTIVLGLFIPLVLAIGESVGSQTSAIVMGTLLRGPTRIGHFLGKELVIGIVLGLFSAVMVGGLVLLFRVPGRVAATIAGAVSLSVAWAALLGVSIPYILRKTRVDPSIAGGPVVLLLCDLSTLAIYLGGAQFVLL